MGAAARIALLSIVVLVVSVFAPAARAHTVYNDAEIELTFEDAEPLLPMVQPDEPDVFSGQVSSSAARCEARRLVRIFRRLPDGGRQAVAADNTSSDGSFSAAVEDPPDGTYFATVSWILYKAGSGHCHYCRSARSPGQPVDNS